MPPPCPADIHELKPLGDRILVKVQESADVTMGGVILPDSAKERPLRWGSAGLPAGQGGRGCLPGFLMHN
jgi:hypothetical protein